MLLFQQLVDLLLKKKELFLELEETTSDMSVVPFESLVDRMEQRGQLLEEIGRIDGEIKEICQGDDEARAALNHTCDREGLTPELEQLYDLSLGIKAVVNRVMKYEEQITMHLEFEKKRIEEKMEALNVSGSAVANRYHQSVQTGIKRAFGTESDKLI